MILQLWSEDYASWSSNIMKNRLRRSNVNSLVLIGVLEDSTGKMTIGNSLNAITEFNLCNKLEDAMVNILNDMGILILLVYRL